MPLFHLARRLSENEHRGIMVSLKLQKRLASSVLKCGTRKIWMDPNEVRSPVAEETPLLPSTPRRNRLPSCGLPQPCACHLALFPRFFAP